MPSDQLIDILGVAKVDFVRGGGWMLGKGGEGEFEGFRDTFSSIIGQDILVVIENVVKGVCSCLNIHKKINALHYAAGC